MANIVVYEDNVNDLASRYGEFDRSHSMHIIYLGDLSESSLEERFSQELDYWLRKNPDEDFGSEFEGDGITRMIGRYRMKPNQFLLTIPETQPEGSVYFVDGLYDVCFSILPRLPKEKTYLVSGNPFIRKNVAEMGFEVIGDIDNTRIRNIVEKLSG
jgi:hypothetical protein